MCLKLYIKRTYLDVNENGTVAAAATGITVRALAIAVEPEPIRFTANHPFIGRYVNKIN